MEGILGQPAGQLTDWQGMLKQEPPQARQALRALLAGRLVFTPREPDGERFYAFEGSGTEILARAELSTATPCQDR